MEKNTTAVFGQAAKTMLYLAWSKKNKSNIQHTVFSNTYSSFPLSKYQIIDSTFIKQFKFSQSQRSCLHEKSSTSLCTHNLSDLIFKTIF